MQYTIILVQSNKLGAFSAVHLHMKVNIICEYNHRNIFTYPFLDKLGLMSVGLWTLYNKVRADVKTRCMLEYVCDIF